MRYLLSLLAACICLGVLGFIPAFSQSKMSPEEEWAKLQQPGEMHKWLQQGVGEWNITAKMWMPGAKEAMEAKGTSKVESILDGRFISEDITVGEGEHAMHVRGFMGYDNAAQKFNACYITNDDTSMRTVEGVMDDKAHTLTFIDKHHNSIYNADIIDRIVATFIDKDTEKLEFYEQRGEMAEGKIAEMNYARKK